MNIQVNINKRHLYAFGLIVVLALGALFVSGYNSGASPAVFGHSLEELGLNKTCLSTQRLTSNGTDVTCATDSDYCRSGSCGSTLSVGNSMQIGSGSSGNYFSFFTTGGTSTLTMGTTGAGTDVDITMLSNNAVNPGIEINRGGTTASMRYNAADFVFTDSINVPSCTGCSTIAEMMEVLGDVEEGDAVCVNPQTGILEVCNTERALSVQGIATSHAELILNLACGKSNNSLSIGGEYDDWTRRTQCEGWFPVAIEGLQEFTKVKCSRNDGSPLQYGDRLVTASDGSLQPLSFSETGGDAIVGIARTICEDGVDSDVIQVLLR